MDTTTRNDPYGNDTAAWWVIGLWTRLAMAGALAAFGGVAMLAEQATLDLSALGLIVVGAAIGAGARRMAQRALDRLVASPGAATASKAGGPPSLPEVRVQRRSRRAWAVSP
jgi:hypothetical protein